jgi:hypothetical protein
MIFASKMANYVSGISVSTATRLKPRLASYQVLLVVGALKRKANVNEVLEATLITSHLGYRSLTL